MAWELSDDEENGVSIAVNTILKKAYGDEAYPQACKLWWEREWAQLDGKKPDEVIASDPCAVVELAIQTLTTTTRQEVWN